MKSVYFLLLLSTLTPSFPLPLPSDSSETEETTITPSASDTQEYSAPSLIVVDENPETETEDVDTGDNEHKQKRHRPTPSPEELEERRVALIKALGGGGGDGEDDGQGGGQLSASIMGLGSLATDVVSLLGSNANETFAPLREARQRARENFPDLGTQLNRYLKNGREYATRAYRGLLKNARVKLTNTLRFILSAVTRLASTIGGLYQVVVSLLDVATKGIGTGVRVGSRLLAVGSNATVHAVARGTNALRTLSDSGLLIKPFNQAVKTGRENFKGLSEDLFDKVEWAQEGLNSKIELVQALAPNILLRAHESTTTEISSTGGDGGDSLGGYSKLNGNEDEMVLLSLASTAAELMNRGGRGADAADVMKMLMEGTSSTVMTEGSTSGSTSSTTPMTPEGPNQGLLNDIFGLQEDINELKENSTVKS